MLKKINWKSFIICIVIPLVIGFLGNLLGDITNNFNQIAKPGFTPPSIVFPIVWSILYILMGISIYLINQSNSETKKKAVTIYTIQLLVNLLWPLFFFKFKFFLFSFLWLLILIALVLSMIFKFLKINKLAAYLQIPYLLWLVFAAVLNYQVYLMN